MSAQQQPLPHERKLCSACFRKKRLMAFDSTEAVKEVGVCRVCKKDLNTADADVARRVRARLKRVHGTKTRSEWVDMGHHNTLAIEGASLRVSTEKAHSLDDVEAAFEVILRAYGGPLNLASIMAADLFHEDVPLTVRLRHHRLVLSLINAHARQRAAVKTERARLRMARAMSSEDDCMLDHLAEDNRAMSEAAGPVVALSKHGVLHMVLEWCLANRVIHPRDIPIRPRELYERRRKQKSEQPE